jgi:hypothetical protein
MLLDEVDSQYNWLVEVGNDVKLVLYGLGTNLNLKLVSTINWQNLPPCRFKFWHNSPFNFSGMMLGWNLMKNFLTEARNIGSSVGAPSWR